MKSHTKQTIKKESGDATGLTGSPVSAENEAGAGELTRYSRQVTTTIAVTKENLVYYCRKEEITYASGADAIGESETKPGKKEITRASGNHAGKKMTTKRRGKI